MSFIRWAGGKRLLLKHFKPLFFDLHEHNKFIEPFIGGGSVFFNFDANNYLINDLNRDLSECYKCLTDDELFDNLIAEISDAKYINVKSTFIMLRTRYNQLKLENVQSIERTALFLFMNYTCYNGLYRENKNGTLSAGYGYREKLIFTDACIKKLNKAREYFKDKNVTVMNCDYKEVLEKANPGDFIYLDPPYYDNSHFTTYTKNIFTTQCQDDLIQWCDKLDKLGCHIMYSNSNKDYIKDSFKKLAGNWNIKELVCNRSISCKGTTRKQIIKNEVLITNFI